MTSGQVRVGFDQKVQVSGLGLGIVHIMVLRPILWSFFCNSTSCKGTELKCECFVIHIMLSNVDKELKYNQHIFISSIDSHASHPT